MLTLYVVTCFYTLTLYIYCVSSEDKGKLTTVLDVAQKHIHSSSQLFKLAQDVFKIATPADAPKHMPALRAAFELGLQVTLCSIVSGKGRKKQT
jgi:hypothetical protein